MWAGHHWVEDDYNASFSFIENISTVYNNLSDDAQSKLKDTKESDKQQYFEGIINSVNKRLKLLRTPRGGEAVLVMVQRTRQPMLVLPKDFDKHHYLLPCPNGVVDLRTGDLLNGNPSDYLLKACVKAYTPFLLKCKNMLRLFVVMGRNF